MIIAIEGGDACGKATQAKILAERLDAALFSFPDYTTPAGEAILGNLKGAWEARNNLISATWSELRSRVTKANLTNAIVYGSLDGLDSEWVRKVNVQLPVRPSVYVLLDASVEEGFRRRPERRDRYEKDRDYMEKVRVAYLKLFDEEQRVRAEAVQRRLSIAADLPLWRIVDAVGTVEDVAKRVWAAIAL